MKLWAISALIYLGSLVLAIEEVEVGPAGEEVRGNPRTYCTGTEGVPCFHDPERPEVRSRLHYDRGVPPAPPLAHVHVDDLEKPENEAYRDRRRPFVLTGAMQDWKAMRAWSGGQVLSDWFGDEVVDFYPMNMLKSAGSSPFLFRMRSAWRELEQPPGRGRFGGAEIHEAAGTPGKYLHLQLTEDQWKKLRKGGGMGSPIHKWLRGDGWMKKCIKDKAIRDEYHLKTHWKITLVGQPGAGMHNHSDALRTASWHAHVHSQPAPVYDGTNARGGGAVAKEEEEEEAEGRLRRRRPGQKVRGKWWYVCGTGSGDGPYEGEQRCMEDVLMPGEILFYPQHYHHETQNLGGRTMTVTGTLVTAFNHWEVTSMLHGECTRKHLNFRFSGPLCDALDECFVLWHTHFGAEPGTPVAAAKRQARRMWPKWRTVASAELIQERDAPDALGNNYDGRNAIK